MSGRYSGFHRIGKRQLTTVLIIDDDPEILALWSDVLASDGMSVLTAPSGVQGVKLARSNAVDVILTDVLMPDKDGIETLLEVKAQDATAKVVLVSGGGRQVGMSMLQVADHLGADATLRKPVNVDELCATVRRLAAAA